MNYYELNKVTGEKKLIKNDDIISVTSDYILIKPSDSNATAKMVYDYIEEDEDSSATSLNLKQSDCALFPTSAEAGSNKYMYNVGIENIDVKRKFPEQVCGYITDSITIDSCSYIELSVNRNNSSVPIEFSIIDGSNETPIIPIEESGIIITERLFFGQKLRFTPDDSTDVVIKKDDIATSMTIDEFLALTDIDDNDIYTAEYLPTTNETQYKPTNNSIKIKIIERCDNKIPSVINSMVLKKHGGEKPWNI